MQEVRSVEAMFAAGDRDPHSILDRQRRAFLNDPFPTRAVRHDRLSRAISMLTGAISKIVEALDQDFGGRSEAITLIADVFAPLAALKDSRRNLGRWMKPEKRAPEFPLGLLGVKAWVEYNPLGVVGVVAPWNAPVALSLTPLAGTLAAGNRVMIKPSELAPTTSALLAEMIAEAFDPDEVAVVEGGLDVSRTFVALPFDHLLFTGGGAVARHVMRAAADNLTPVTLELGGKSPAIVGRGANVADAASKIMGGKLSNGGQICMCPDHAWVQADQLNAFVIAAEAAGRRMFPEIADNRDVTKIFGGKARARLIAAIEEARSAGARIVELGDSTLAPPGVIVPTLVIDAPDHVMLNREEVFGPVLPIRTYERLDQLVDQLNLKPTPLALYYFGNYADDIKLIRRCARAGGITLGDVMLHPFMQDLPFGGLGESGMGRYVGHDGFKTFSHHKATVRSGWIDIGKYIQPPYSDRMIKILKFASRA
jgi:coniferyl-aldehyde dehydrogenase